MLSGIAVGYVLSEVSLAAIARNWFAISVKLGLSDGSDDQHLSMSDFHSGSQNSGTGGLKVLLTIPPA